MTLTLCPLLYGCQLGEWAEWEKFTNFEIATRTPLMIKVPAAVDARMLRNASTRALVEIVDVMPTLIELAGGNVSGLGLEGSSLRPLLQGAARHVGDAVVWAGAAAAGTLAVAPAWEKDAAFSQFPRCTRVYPTSWCSPNCGLYNQSRPVWQYNDCNDVPRTNFSHMGLSVRTDTWRFTRWLAWNGTSLRPVWRTGAAPNGMGQDGNRTHPLEELYDHTGDDGNSFDGAYESVNLAYGEAHRAVRDVLDERLRRHFAPWLPTLPPTPAPPTPIMPTPLPTPVPAPSSEEGLGVGLGIAIVAAAGLGGVWNSRRMGQQAGHGKQALLGESLDA